MPFFTGAPPAGHRPSRFVGLLSRIWPGPVPSIFRRLVPVETIATFAFRKRCVVPTLADAGQYLDRVRSPRDRRMTSVFPDVVATSRAGRQPSRSSMLFRVDRLGCIQPRRPHLQQRARRRILPSPRLWTILSGIMPMGMSPARLEQGRPRFGHAEYARCTAYPSMVEAIRIQEGLSCGERIFLGQHPYEELLMNMFRRRKRNFMKCV